MKHHLKPQNLEEVSRRLFERLKPLLPREDPLFLLDTTGIAHKGLTQNLAWKKSGQAPGTGRDCGPGYASDVCPGGVGGSEEAWLPARDEGEAICYNLEPGKGSTPSMTS